MDSLRVLEAREGGVGTGKARKENWLFIGNAGPAAQPVTYTIIENCQNQGLDPFAYLQGVLTRLPYSTNH